MSKQTIYLIGIALTILLGSWLYCRHCCYCDTKEVVKKVKKKHSPQIDSSFNLTGSGFEYSCDGNFNFLPKSFNHEIPVDKCIDDGILKLKSFLDKNPNAILKITGYCLNSEKNISAFPNLGYARAIDIKNYFISKGVSSNRFETSGEIKNNWKANEKFILGPVNYIIINDIVEAKGGDWKALKEKINGNPLILYFNTNQTEITLTDEERTKIADLTRYLDNVTSAKIHCEGHSDNTGDRNINIQLGLDRANFAKEYFIKNGITKDRIDAVSKGPDEPIADNLTPEGKSENRRTVITLK
ncbi:OmpA family protein [Flavobacterium sp. H122]|uniref:OmpA family protein n=1 Tax=Flavobacterium sp. H122 TaxID=2529860 RepID=UPI0010AA90F6|nr:OmpA family protein [Flavobacterium sp. H122]